MMRRDQFYDSAWKQALRAAGLAEDRFVFHSLRHFCASNLLAEGAPLAAVAGHLGDTVDTVSRAYVHWLRDDREVPAAVLVRVLAPTNASDDSAACSQNVPKTRERAPNRREKRRSEGWSAASRPVGGVLSTGPLRVTGWVAIHLRGLPGE
jgi:hypothetical protein